MRDLPDGSMILIHGHDEIKFVPPEQLKPWPYGTELAVRVWLRRRKNGMI